MSARSQSGRAGASTTRRRRVFGWGLCVIVVAILALAVFDRTLVRHWFPQFAPEAWRTLDEPGMEPVPVSLADLPLTVIRGADPGAPLVILLSGNLGWWAIDEGLSQGFRARGATTVGVNSLAYFVHRRTPADIAAAIGRIVATMGPERDLVLVGYSYGADILATSYERLDPAVRARVRLVSLLAMSKSVRYGIGFWKWFAEQHDTVPAVGEIAGPSVACLQGVEERRRSGCNLLDPAKVDVVTLPGGHHFDGDYAALAARVWSDLPARP